MDAYISTVVDFVPVWIPLYWRLYGVCSSCVIVTETLSVSNDYSDAGRMLLHNTISNIICSVKRPERMRSPPSLLFNE
jgi:hypothetical protein